MVTRKAPLDDDDLIDLLERELLEGVKIEQAPGFVEDTQQTALGGLVKAEEHVRVRELEPE
jgi:hypothetical protein